MGHNTNASIHCWWPIATDQPVRVGRATSGVKMNKFLIAVVATSALIGCSTMQKMTPSYRHAQERTQALEQLQLTTMRYADEYRTRVVEAVNRIQDGPVTPEERLAAQNWKVLQAQAVYIDADGPNPALNTLDIVVLATLSRMVIDDASAQYGDRVQFLQKTHRDLERSAWELAKPVLSEAQAAQLRDIIARWREQNPTVRSVGAIHFTDFAKSIGEPGANEANRIGSIFSIVNLNPFAELDPAVQEITQTRQLAERAIFYFQRMPDIVSMQAEQVVFRMAVQPETKNALASFQRVSLVGSAADTLATDLPTILDKEREALLRQVTQEITGQSATIGELSGNLRSTLEAGTATADALNTMLQSLNKLTAQFVSTTPAPKTPAQPSGPPFDIRNYTEALRAATDTAQQLTALTQQLNTTMPGIRSATQSLVDNIVRQVLLILAVLILGTFGASLAYRVIVLRMQRQMA
jgi:hypothetical protein